MKKLQAILNDEGTINIIEKTNTGLTCLKRVKNNKQLEKYLKTINYLYIIKDF